VTTPRKGTPTTEGNEMALAIDVSKLPAGMSKREVAVSAGLAKKGRGPFSKEARTFLEKIEADGYVFETAAPVVKVTGERIDTKDMDLDAFRTWAGTKGYPVGDRGRIKNEYLVEYVAENPDYAKRAVVQKSERVASTKTEAVKIDRKSYDPKIVRQWAIDNGESVPARGKLSDVLIAKYLDSHKDSATPAPVRENTEDAFAPTPQRAHFENAFEALDIDGKTKIRKSWKDCDSRTGYSIGYVPGPVFTFSGIDLDRELELTPVR
jgi:hypothetical protein